MNQHDRDEWSQLMIGFVTGLIMGGLFIWAVMR